MRPKPSDFFKPHFTLYEPGFHLGRGISIRHAETSHPGWGDGGLAVGESRSTRFGGRWASLGHTGQVIALKGKSKKPDSIGPERFYSKHFELFQAGVRHMAHCFRIIGEAGQSGTGGSKVMAWRKFLRRSGQTGHCWAWDGNREYQDTYDLEIHEGNKVTYPTVQSFALRRGPYAISRHTGAERFQRVIKSPMGGDIVSGLRSVRPMILELFPTRGIRDNAPIYAMIQIQGWGVHVDEHGRAQYAHDVWTCPNIEVYISLMVGDVALPRVGWQKWYSRRFGGSFTLERESWNWDIVPDVPGELILPNERHPLL